ncbi:Mo25-like, putative [Trypanosoma equiperdum]|uniref:Mo25-like, putative n=1 Tax=Trypanosoma equiperdum TaxID=5694 RepID=A0A1G4IHY7_TRYEQ|nr:Mo25-like, putative [Trypanosoma equiperdum]
MRKKSVQETDEVPNERLPHILSSSDDPTEVNKALVVLLRRLRAGAGEPISLSPATLSQLLRILVGRTDDAWLEVRKKIAFVFSELLSKDNADVLADALLYGRLHTTTSSEARASRIDFGGVDENSAPDPFTSLKKMKEILGKLAEAHGTVERCVPAADVFRTFLRLPALLEVIMSPEPLFDVEDNDGSAPAHRATRKRCFNDTCIGILCRSAQAYTTALCTETWRSLSTALCTNKALSAPLLLCYFNEFVGMFLGCLEGDNFVAKLHALELIDAILEDAAFLKARPKLAESPALLCALLPLTNSRSQHIRFLTFDAIKVFIAKGNKPAPIRYILYINRETLARYVEDYSPNEATIGKVLSAEKEKILRSLLSLEPLSHEEEVLLNASA